MMNFFSGPMGWYTSILLVIPAMLLAMYAQIKVSSTFNRYLQTPLRNPMTGEAAARRILDANGLYHVKIRQVPGKLSDHYDPRNQTVNLSPEVFSGTSVSSVSVACHECGHAIQHKEAYGPLALRSFLVPVTNFASGLAIPLFLIGLFVGIQGLEIIGILFFACAVFFQCVTLPVEFNASSRAIAQMEMTGIIGSEEKGAAQKVLSAAALTYVASMLVSLMELLRLVMLARSRE